MRGTGSFLNAKSVGRLRIEATVRFSSVANKNKSLNKNKKSCILASYLVITIILVLFNFIDLCKMLRLEKIS